MPSDNPLYQLNPATGETEYVGHLDPSAATTSGFLPNYANWYDENDPNYAPRYAVMDPYADPHGTPSTFGDQMSAYIRSFGMDPQTTTYEQLPFESWAASGAGLYSSPLLDAYAPKFTTRGEAKNWILPYYNSIEGESRDALWDYRFAVALADALGASGDPQVQAYLASALPDAEARVEYEHQRDRAGRTGVMDILKGAAFVLGAATPLGWAGSTAGMIGGSVSPEVGALAGLAVGGLGGLSGAGGGMLGGGSGGELLSGFDQVGDLGASGYSSMMDAVAGNVTGIPALDNVISTWRQMPSWQRQAISAGTPLAAKVAAGEELTMRDLVALAGPIADAAAAGEISLTGAEDAPPAGYMSEMDLGGWSDMAPGAIVNMAAFNPFAQNMSYVPGSIDAALQGGGDVLSALTGAEPTYSPAMPDAYASVGNFDAGVPFVDPTSQDAEPQMPPAPEPDALTQDTAGAEEPAAAEPEGKSLLSRVKPSTILSLAEQLYRLYNSGQDVGEFSQSEEGQRIAAEVEAIDPANQELIRAEIQKANDLIEEILEIDIDELTEQEFAKRVEALAESRDKDFAKLLAVLYKRGLLGLKTYGESFEGESYDLAEGEGANPYTAAFHSGIERINAGIGESAREDAQRYVDMLLENLMGTFPSKPDGTLASLFAGRGAGLFSTDELSDTAAQEERKRLRAMFGKQEE